MHALLDSLTGPDGPVSVTGEIAWRRRPALYREHAVFLTVSPDQAREQLACGAHVIMAAGEQSAVREQITAAQAGPPLTEAEAFGRLREIFTAHATPVRLAALARQSGLPGHLVTGRQIAVVARVPDAAGAATLAASLRTQQTAPGELVVAVAARPGESAEVSCHAVTAALGDLAGQGMMITAVSVPPEADAGGGWLRRAAQTARSPWVAPWQADREYDPSYLLDLACARECAQADAVGHTGSGYAYVTSLDPALARREFFSPDGSGPAPRLFSVS